MAYVFDISNRTEVCVRESNNSFLRDEIGKLDEIGDKSSPTCISKEKQVSCSGAFLPIYSTCSNQTFNYYDCQCSTKNYSTCAVEPETPVYVAKACFFIENLGYYEWEKNPSFSPTFDEYSYGITSEEDCKALQKAYDGESQCFVKDGKNWVPTTGCEGSFLDKMFYINY